ncbi:MAG: hypothetical protein WC867_03360 [Candidatus Pacearchaeota archaeon]|jgi:hypothetical protein
MDEKNINNQGQKGKLLNYFFLILFINLILFLIIEFIRTSQFRDFYFILKLIQILIFIISIILVLSGLYFHFDNIYANSKNRETKSGIEIKIRILITIFILGPLVFVGSCFPIGFYGVTTQNIYSTKAEVYLLAGLVIGTILAFFVVIKTIKFIKEKYG